MRYINPPLIDWLIDCTLHGLDARTHQLDVRVVSGVVTGSQLISHKRPDPVTAAVGSDLTDSIVDSRAAVFSTAGLTLRRWWSTSLISRRLAARLVVVPERRLRLHFATLWPRSLASPHGCSLQKMSPASSLCIRWSTGRPGGSSARSREASPPWIRLHCAGPMMLVRLPCALR